MGGGRKPPDSKAGTWLDVRKETGWLPEGVTDGEGWPADGGDDAKPDGRQSFGSFDGGVAPTRRGAAAC